MTPLVKGFTLVVALAVITTLVLPGRQTPQVVNAFGNATSSILGTAMGTRS